MFQRLVWTTGGEKFGFGCLIGGVKVGFTLGLGGFGGKVSFGFGFKGGFGFVFGLQEAAGGDGGSGLLLGVEVATGSKIFISFGMLWPAIGYDRFDWISKSLQMTL